MPVWMKWAISLAFGFGFILLGWRLADSRWFGWLLPTFFVVNCLFLIIVVLLQSGKAADIAGAFGGAGSQTAFGPRGAATVLSRATTWCAIMFMVCAMALVLHTDKFVGSGSVLEKVSKPAPKPTPPAKPQSGIPAPPSSTPSAPLSGNPSTPQTNSKPQSTNSPANQPSTQWPAAQQPSTQEPAQQPANPQQPPPTKKP
jgi:preprotein translocase subunit SecG